MHEVHARFVSSRIHDLQKRVDLKGNSVSCVTTLCRKNKKQDTKYWLSFLWLSTNAKDRGSHRYENDNRASILTEFKKLPMIKINWRTSGRISLFRISRKYEEQETFKTNIIIMNANFKERVYREFSLETVRDRGRVSSICRIKTW